MTIRDKDRNVKHKSKDKDKGSERENRNKKEMWKKKKKIWNWIFCSSFSDTHLLFNVFDCVRIKINRCRKEVVFRCSCGLCECVWHSTDVKCVPRLSICVKEANRYFWNSFRFVLNEAHFSWKKLPLSTCICDVNRNFL